MDGARDGHYHFAVRNHVKWLVATIDRFDWPSEDEALERMLATRSVPGADELAGCRDLEIKIIILTTVYRLDINYV